MGEEIIGVVMRAEVVVGMVGNSCGSGCSRGIEGWCNRKCSDGVSGCRRLKILVRTV